MRRSLDVCLWDVRKFAALILTSVDGKNFEQYFADQILQFAVERQFTLLGEALVRVRLHFLSEFDKIENALKIVRFRNRLVHLYDLMKDEEVWRVIELELPLMVAQVDSMLEELRIDE